MVHIKKSLKKKELSSKMSFETEDQRCFKKKKLLLKQAASLLVTLSSM